MTVEAPALVADPYVGPRPFEAEDRTRFFGRDIEIDELVSYVYANRVVVLYSQSGAGKTSLLKAGLGPALEEEGFQVLPVTRVGGLVVDDAGVANVFAYSALARLTPEDVDVPPAATLSNVLAELPRPPEEDGEPLARVVVLDQFEELFTTHAERWPERAAFFTQMRRALDDDPVLRVVLSLREDYLAQLDPLLPALRGITSTRFRLQRLGEKAALAAIKKPIEATPRRYGEGVAELLAAELMKIRVERAAGDTVDVAGEYVEPVQLQVVCETLWDSLPADVTEITEEHLRQFGDVNQALMRFYEQSVADAVSVGRRGRGGTARVWGIVRRRIATESDIRAWFEHEAITPAGTRGTVYGGERDAGGLPNEAVDALVESHVIRAERRRGSRWYEITHDRFIGPVLDANQRWRRERRSMLTKWAAWAVAALAILFAVVLWQGIARSGGETIATGSRTLAFGQVAVGASPKEEFAVNLEGVDVATLALVRGSGEFSLPEEPTTGCVDQASCVRVVFAPVAQSPVGDSGEPMPSTAFLEGRVDGERTTLALVSGVGSAPPEPTLSVTELDFGDMSLGSRRTLPVVVTNSGPVSLDIIPDERDTVSWTGCDGARPGATCEVQVSFKATRVDQAPANVELPYQYRYEAELAGYTAAGSAPTLVARATVMPLRSPEVRATELTLPEPEAEGGLDFGGVEPGSTSAIAVTIVNPAGLPLDLPEATVDPIGAPFQLDLAACQLPVPAGEACAGSLVFAPTDAGLADAVVEIRYAYQPELDVEDSSLSGALRLRVTGEGRPGPDVNPGSIDFGTVIVGSGRSAAVTVTNGASSEMAIALDLELASPQRTSEDPTGVSFDGCAGPVPAGESCTIDVEYLPAAAAELEAGLNIEYSFGAMPRTTVVVIQGSAEALEVSPPIDLDAAPTSVSVLGDVVWVAAGSTVTPVRGKGTAFEVSGSVVAIQATDEGVLALDDDGLLSRNGGPPVATGTGPDGAMAFDPLRARVWLVDRGVPLATLVDPSGEEDTEGVPLLDAVALSDVAVGFGLAWVSDPGADLVFALTDTDLFDFVEVPGAFAVATGKGFVWVLGDGGLVRIDPEMFVADEPVALEPEPLALAVGGGVVWVALDDGTVAGFHTGSLERLAVVEVADPTAVSVGEDGIAWVLSGAAQTLTRIELPAGLEGTFAFAGG